MDTFRWISVVLSMILGLGITRLLTGMVAVFRTRKRAAPDAIALSWAAIIFVQQLAFWWGIEELATLVTLWSLAGFLLLVGLVLTLFVAAALILPSSELSEGEGLRDYFDDDGRWALIAVATFNGLAVVADVAFWKLPLLSWQGGVNLALIALPLVAVQRSLVVRRGATLVYAAVLAAGLAMEVPLTQ